MSLQLFVPSEIVVGYETIFVVYDNDHDYDNFQNFKDFKFIYTSKSGAQVKFEVVGTAQEIRGFVFIPAICGKNNGKVCALVLRVQAEPAHEFPNPRLFTTDSGSITGSCNSALGTPVLFDPVPVTVSG